MRAVARNALAAVGICLFVLAFIGCGRKQPAQGEAMSIHYLEIVTEDVDKVCRLYEQVDALSFGSETTEMGQARLAVRADGSMVGVRRPLADHESPIMRTYVAVENAQQAVNAAEASGAMVAYPPTEQGEYGTFAIVIQGGVQHGLWQRP
ncbi:MAG: hypothetical protein AAGA56_11510 [Myxococcota bacterium]